MPRISKLEYLARRYFLKTAWESYDCLYTLLPPHKQWEVHAYYRPTQDLTDEEAIRLRLEANKKDPSLAAKASVSFKKMQKVFYYASNVAGNNDIEFREAVSSFIPASKVPGKNYSIRVAALAKPEPDLRKLALALIDMARLELEGEKQKVA